MPVNSSPSFSPSHRPCPTTRSRNPRSSLITISTLPSNARLLTDLLCLDQRQFSHFLASRGAMPYRKRGGQSDGHRTRDNGAMFGNLSRHLGLGSDTCFIRLRAVTGKPLSFFCIPFSFPSPGLSGTRS